jgi:hypothetical protein
MTAAPASAATATAASADSSSLPAAPTAAASSSAHLTSTSYTPNFGTLASQPARLASLVQHAQALTQEQQQTGGNYYLGVVRDLSKSIFTAELLQLVYWGIYVRWRQRFHPDVTQLAPLGNLLVEDLCSETLPANQRFDPVMVRRVHEDFRRTKTLLACHQDEQFWIQVAIHINCIQSTTQTVPSMRKLKELACIHSSPAWDAKSLDLPTRHARWWHLIFHSDSTGAPALRKLAKQSQQHYSLCMIALVQHVLCSSSRDAHMPCPS